MRRLGDELGFEAMSLYRHVANKQDLLDGMLDLVLAEWQLPDGKGDWAEAIRTSANSVHDALRRHPLGGAPADDREPPPPGAPPLHGRPARPGCTTRGSTPTTTYSRLPPARRLHLRLLALGDRVHDDPDGRRGRDEADGDDPVGRLPASRRASRPAHERRAAPRGERVPGRARPDPRRPAADRSARRLDAERAARRRPSRWSMQPRPWARARRCR